MIIQRWPLVAADLRAEYGFDVYDRASQKRTRWAATRSMIGGLMSAETRLSRWFEHTYGKKQKTPTGKRR